MEVVGKEETHRGLCCSLAGCLVLLSEGGQLLTESSLALLGLVPVCLGSRHHSQHLTLQPLQVAAHHATFTAHPANMRESSTAGDEFNTWPLSEPCVFFLIIFLFK